jgi:hypothetical protein
MRQAPARCKQVNPTPTMQGRDFGRKLIKIEVSIFRKVPIGSDGLAWCVKVGIVPARLGHSLGTAPASY